MKIIAVALILLAGFQCATSAGLRVKAPLGGNASVCCPYHRGSESYPKYFSKGRPGERFEIVRANRLRTWSTDDRFSLEDDQEKKEFTVTIRNLSVEDAGLYWCGVDWWGPDKPTEVNLDVVQDILPSSQSSSTQNASLQNTTSSPFKSAWGETHHLVTQSNEIPITDKSVYFWIFLAVVVLLCATMSVFGMSILVLIKKNNAKKTTESTQPRTCTQSNRDSHIYEDTVLTNHRPDIVTCDTPATLSPCSDFRPSARSQLPHQESVVYSVINIPKAPADDAIPFLSAESASLHYATVNTVQSSQVVRDSSAFAGRSHDIYAIIRH
ncbi:uncharacterized protein [Salminus brasiliensis]|uniref:uncharacterized protein isoform X1 n=1 Tax=Salminus brasiliensis TaxID=930266 RepID=UPI003B833D8B